MAGRSSRNRPGEEGIGIHPASGTFLVETYTCSTVIDVLPGLVTQW